MTETGPQAAKVQGAFYEAAGTVDPLGLLFGALPSLRPWLEPQFGYAVHTQSSAIRFIHWFFPVRTGAHCRCRYQRGWILVKDHASVGARDTDIAEQLTIGCLKAES